MWICNYKLIGQDVWLSAPGGTLSDEVTSTEVCLFKAQEDMETMQAYAQVSACKSLPRNKCSLGVCAKPCLIFRFLTNSSGATSIWRKILKKRLKRCVSCTFVGKWEVLKTIMCNFIQPERRGWFFFFFFLDLQLLLFLKGFTESERTKLAMLTGILLANGNISASILSSLFNENLVKKGNSLFVW